MKDGLYLEIFVVKDCARYCVKIIDSKKVSDIMANSVMDGLAKVIGIEDADRQNEKVCTGKRCPMQVGYDVKNCKAKDCIYRTETEKGGVQK